MGSVFTDGINLYRDVWVFLAAYPQQTWAFFFVLKKAWKEKYGRIKSCAAFSTYLSVLYYRDIQAKSSLQLCCSGENTEESSITLPLSKWIQIELYPEEAGKGSWDCTSSLLEFDPLSGGDVYYLDRKLKMEGQHFSTATEFGQAFKSL